MLSKWHTFDTQKRFESKNFCLILNTKWLLVKLPKSEIPLSPHSGSLERRTLRCARFWGGLDSQVLGRTEDKVQTQDPSGSSDTLTQAHKQCQWQNNYKKTSHPKIINQPIFAQGSPKENRCKYYSPLGNSNRQSTRTAWPVGDLVHRMRPSSTTTSASRGHHDPGPSYSTGGSKPELFFGNLFWAPRGLIRPTSSRALYKKLANLATLELKV